MIITISEATVSSERWQALEQAFREGVKKAPQQLRQTYLLQDRDHPQTWRTIAVWRSVEAYEEACAQGAHELCAQVFNSVGVQPTRRVFNVLERHEHV